jgi:hypothetical protein
MKVIKNGASSACVMNGFSGSEKTCSYDRSATSASLDQNMALVIFECTTMGADDDHGNGVACLNEDTGDINVHGSMDTW